MRANRCDYCNSEDYSDTIIWWLFGIRHCPQHKESAKKDCDTYLRMENKIRLKDLPMLTPFLNKSIQVLRSNGTYESDWQIRKSDPMSPTWFCKIEGGWSLPVEKLDGSLSKYIAIKSLLFVIPGLQEVIDEHERITAEPSIPLTQVVEHPGIETAFLEDGREVRIFRPSLSLEEAPTSQV